MRRPCPASAPWLAFIGVAALFAAAVAGPARRSTAHLVRPQSPAPPATVYLPDWGLRSANEIRLGQVSLIHDSTAPRLAVYRLNAEEAPVFPDDFNGVAPATADDVLLVDDFAAGNRNRLGGYFGVFEGPPSTAEATVAYAPDGRRALQLNYDKQPGGFCGVWVHLFDFTLPPPQRRFLDARSFSHLGFWIRGERGGERLRLKLADAAWERRGDALPLGEVSEFLPEGTVLTSWQRARVPLSRIPARVDLALLASVVFEVGGVGAGRVYITALGFSVSDEDALALPAPADRPSARRRSLGKATWVWNTAEILDDHQQRARLLDVLTAQGFDQAFLQLVDVAGAERPVGLIEPDPRLRGLVAALKRWGIRAYALDGFKDYALPQHHRAVLGTVDNVIRYNEESLPAERFAGIHHDIEPYLLAGFNGAHREEILRGYLELVAESARRAGEAGLEYAVDIPFWYDAPDEYSYEPVTVEFGGVRKAVSQHLIDLVDGVTLMDYRTVAFGADGTIRQAEGELEYAAARSKPVMIGLETAPLPDEELFDFVGAPQAGLPPREAMSARIVLAVPAGDSTAFFVLPASDDGLAQETVAAWVRGWGLNDDQVIWWPVRQRVHVPGDKLSFHRLGARALERVMAETSQELSAYPSFAGFALHHAWSYAELLAERGSRD